MYKEKYMTNYPSSIDPSKINQPEIKEEKTQPNNLIVESAQVLNDSTPTPPSEKIKDEIISLVSNNEDNENKKLKELVELITALDFLDRRRNNA